MLYIHQMDHYICNTSEVTSVTVLASSHPLCIPNIMTVIIFQTFWTLWLPSLLQEIGVRPFSVPTQECPKAQSKDYKDVMSLV